MNIVSSKLLEMTLEGQRDLLTLCHSALLMVPEKYEDERNKLMAIVLSMQYSPVENRIGHFARFCESFSDYFWPEEDEIEWWQMAVGIMLSSADPNLLARYDGMTVKEFTYASELH